MELRDLDDHIFDEFPVLPGDPLGLSPTIRDAFWASLGQFCRPNFEERDGGGGGGGGGEDTLTRREPEPTHAQEQHKPFGPTPSL